MSTTTYKTLFKNLQFYSLFLILKHELTQKHKMAKPLCVLKILTGFSFYSTNKKPRSGVGGGGGGGAGAGG
ncbi:MAG: hypothetical protein ACK400_09530, partial [Pseudanabaena sp.]